LFLFSCATTTPGTKQSSSIQDLNYYVNIVSDLSDENFMMYQVSFENKTREWIVLESPTILTNTPAELEQLQTITGEKLKAWLEAKTLENSVSSYNTQMSLAAIGVAGGVMMASASDINTASWGAAIYAGSFTALAVNELLQSKRSVEFQNSLPGGHMLNKVLVPPMKVVQKWIMIQYPYRDPGPSNKPSQRSYLPIPFGVKYKVSKVNSEKIEKNILIQVE
ncbi:MAG: hypothetical protein QE271_01080, partial [Bacteriovoracaceae bacterium]|nr:hypothetical protein [Bacteriovoracaceae bacterium]